jgi:DNA invertase Pin-like site-specific DNA recombinase
MPDSPWAVIYLRKSRDKAELADPDLLHKHRRELLRRAAERGHDVAPERIFEEKGSGDTLRARPECRRMLALLDQRPRHAGGYLWTTEVSRLTRGVLSDRALIYDALIRPGVVHCTRDRDYDLHKAGDLYYWETETAQARRELGVYRERIDAARLDMALEGRPPTGHVPFGWLWDRNARNPDGSRGRAETDPARFPVVQALCEEIFSLSTYALAAKYNLCQVMVAHLLRNPFICGYPCRRWFPHGGERVRRDTGEAWLSPSHCLPREHWIWPKEQAAHQAACTREHWEAIQAALDQRRDERAKTGAADGWCRGVVRFVGYDRRARLGSRPMAGGSQLVYELSVPPRTRTSICIRRVEVHQAVQAALLPLLGDPDALRRGLDDYRRHRGQAPPTDLEELRAEARTLEGLLDALLDRELRAGAARDTREVASVMRQREQYKRDLAAVEGRLAALQAARPVDAGLDELERLLRRIEPGDLADLWRLWEAERNYAALQQVTAGFVAAVVCRVERAPGEHFWQRRVEAVRLKAPWR